MGIQAGDVAPDFTLPSTDKRDISLSDYKGEKYVLLVFFPLDFTPG
ncbi:peroxiredoxin Q/BCP [Alteribacillus persepolensis]|uniref:Peroxiredoxin Q/BCP n=1 Tax=Alteribacillus persepolensis TaxID=568899 RepID=A0A1G8C189_9BACI|nr:peroxiredoxin Q/BCP [Alteribacillus persepolensis]